MLPIASAFVGGIGGGLISGSVSSAIAAPLREIQTAANRSWANNFPTLDALLHAFNKGQISRLLLNEIALWNGAKIDEESANLSAIAWRGVLKSGMPAIEPGLAFSLYNTNDNLDPRWADNTNRSYGYQPGLAQKLLDQQFSPSVDEAITNWFLGAYSLEQRNAIVSRFGLVPGNRLDTYVYQSDPLGQNQVIDLWNRGLILDSQCDNWLAASGLRYDQLIKSVQQLSALQCPPAGQLIQFATSGATNAEFANQWGLYSGMPQWLNQWLSYAGQGKPNLPIPGIAGQPDSLSWGAVQWAASRQTLNIGQAMRLLHLLRPGRESRFISAGLSVSPFSVGMFETIVQSQGYTQQSAAYLAALSFTRPRIFDIRRGIQLGTMTDDQANVKLQDIGYLPDDAKTYIQISHDIADAKQFAFIDQMVNTASKQTAQAIISGYNTGLISVDDARQQLESIGFSGAQASQLLFVEDAKFAHETVRESIAAVKSAYFTGALSSTDVAQAMTTIGVLPQRVALYLQRWNMRRNLARRTASVAKVVSWYASSLITYDQAFARLTNLGMNQPDSLILLIEAGKKMEDLNARALKAQEATKANQAKQLAALAREHDKAAANARRGVAALTPKSTLIKWLKDGVIDSDYFMERMLLLGYPDDIIMRYIDDAEVKPKPKAVGSGQAAQTAIPAGGTLSQP
jgi:hypothetical protein